MEGTTLMIIAVLIVLFSAWLSCKTSRLRDLPGPWTNGLPIIGSFLVMRNKPYVKLTEMSKKYGPLYRLRVGSTDIVVITDFEIIKEAFAKNAFIGRSQDPIIKRSKETIELKTFTGMPWIEQKKFSMHLLRDLGFGKTKMEEHIKEEILELLQRISDEKGKPVKYSFLLAPSISNNIFSLIFGKRLKYNDPEKQQLDHIARNVGKLIHSTSKQFFFPWLRAVMSTFKIGDNRRLSKLIEDLRIYSNKEIEQHEATFDPNNTRDFVDGYLLEIQKRKNDPNTTFRKGVLLDLMRTLFLAGTETVTTTLGWMLLVCATYPEVQKRIYSEIDDVIGQERFPTRNDHLNMPFTEAAMLELMRWKTIFPFNIMKYTLEDTELKGYFIPKNTRVLPVHWAIDHDPKLWGKDAHEYKPVRFLSQDGSKVVKPEYYIPFSIGNRTCPGKSLAEMEVFLYLVAILQKFEVHSPPGQPVDLEEELALNLLPREQALCFKQRL